MYDHKPKKRLQMTSKIEATRKGSVKETHIDWVCVGYDFDTNVNILRLIA